MISHDDENSLIGVDNRTMSVLLRSGVSRSSSPSLDRTPDTVILQWGDEESAYVTSVVSDGSSRDSRLDLAAVQAAFRPLQTTYSA